MRLTRRVWKGRQAEEEGVRYEGGLSHHHHLTTWKDIKAQPFFLYCKQKSKVQIVFVSGWFKRKIQDAGFPVQRWRTAVRLIRSSTLRISCLYMCVSLHGPEPWHVDTCASARTWRDSQPIRETEALWLVARLHGAPQSHRLKAEPQQIHHPDWLAGKLWVRLPGYRNVAVAPLW